MKKTLKYLSFLMLLFTFFVKVNAVELSQTDYESLNIKRAYVIGDYAFDMSKHPPTLKDLMLAAQSAPDGDVSIIEIKIAKNILTGETNRTYVDVLNNLTYDSFPTIDVEYVYESAINPNNPSQETKTDLSEIFGYSVEFMDGNNVLYEDVVDEGETATAPSNTTKLGYTFDNWYTTNTFETVYDFSNQITSNTNIYGKWIANQYTINFDDNTEDIVENMPLAITKAYGTNSANLSIPTRVGYDFLGWDTRDEAIIASITNNVVSTDLTTGTTSQTLYAIWSPKQYTVSFNSKGGSEVTSITQDYKSNIIAPVNPDKIGYDFDGWYTDEELLNLYTFTTMPLNGITLYAKWNLKQYTISFNSNGGSAVTSITQNYGTSVTIPDDPTKTGYDFDKWQLNGVDYTFTTIPAKNIELTAVWIPKTYRVRFNFELFATSNSALCTYGVDCRLDGASSIIEGYKFEGWDTDASADTVVYTPSTVNAYTYINNGLPNEEGYFNLYAVSSPIEYTIIYNKNNDNVTGTMANTICTYENDCVLNNNDYESDDYTFAGWATSSDGEVVYNNGQTITHYSSLVESSSSNLIELYAKWTPKQYTIIFNKNTEDTVENMPSSITQNYNSTVVSPTNPIRMGYRFAGWYTDASVLNEYVYTFNKMPSGGKTLYAKWESQSIPVNYQVEVQGVGKMCVDQNYDGICDRDINDDIIYQIDSSTNEIVTNMNNTYRNYISSTSATFDINSIEELTERFKTKSGYEFLGWYEVVNKFDNACSGIAPYEIIVDNDINYYCVNNDKVSTTPIDFSEPITLTGNLSVYAVFEPVPQAVTFNLNGGTALTASGENKISGITIATGRNKQLPVLTSTDLAFPNNAEFLGWSKTKNTCDDDMIMNNECFIVNEENEIVIDYFYLSGPTTLYAVWNYNKVTVNYNFLNFEDIDPYETRRIMQTSVLTKGQPFTPLNGSAMNYSTEPAKTLNEYYSENNQTLVYWSSFFGGPYYDPQSDLYSLTDSITIPTTEWLLMPTIDVYPVTRYNEMTVNYYSSIEDYYNDNPPIVTNTINYGETLTLPSNEIDLGSSYIWTGWEAIDVLGNRFAGIKNGTIENFNYNAIHDDTVSFLPTSIPTWYDENATEYTIDGTNKTFADLLLILPILNSNQNDITIYVNEDNVVAVGNPVIGSNITMTFSNSLAAEDTSATLIVDDSITVEGELRLNKDARDEIDFASSDQTIKSIVIKNGGKLFVEEEELISRNDTATIVYGENSIINVGTDNLGFDIIEIVTGTATINKTNNLGRDEDNYAMYSSDALILNENTILYVNVNMLMGGMIDGKGTMDIADNITVQKGAKFSPNGYISDIVIISEEDTSKITQYSSPTSPTPSTITVSYFMNDEISSVPYLVSAPLNQGTNYQLITNNPSRDGYIFVGWSTNPNNDAMYNSGETIPNLQNSMALYAIWALDE